MVYDVLKALCAERGLTVTKLCTIVTGNSGNLATWKKGIMRSDYLAGCAKALNVSADTLLEISPSADSQADTLLKYFSECSELDKQYLIDMALMFAKRERDFKEKESASP